MRGVGLLEQYIERLIDGQFEYDRGMLEFSEQRIELTLRPGDMVEGSFQVFGPEDRPVEGHVSSTEIRMEVLTPTFSGDRDEIGYRFRAEGLNSGDVLKGDFRIVSNRGEYLVPFVVTIVIEHVESTMGEIRNLFHFANLAKTDWNEAMRLFYHEDFELILSGHDARYRSVYRGLSVPPADDLALEEFLYAIHKKQKITYIPEQETIVWEDVPSVIEETVAITRNGWGYTSLDVTADGDFLLIDKTHIDGSDFVGNTCRYRYRIDPSRLHRGKNLGALIFSNVYTTARVRFEVYGERARTEEELAKRAALHEKKELTAQLIRLYASFRMRKIGSGKWLQEAGTLTTKMRAADPADPVCALYQAHFLITASRVPEGEALLKELKPQLTLTDTPDALRCYYLYLTTLLTRDEKEVAAAARQIRSALYGNPGDWRIAWLLQFVSEEYVGSASRKWELFKEQYAHGARTPVLYVEALLVASHHPATLMKLDAFELSVLKYAVREGILPAQLIDRIVYLARHEKRYDERVFQALALCYRMKAQDDTLGEICALLIKGARTDEEAHGWYERGVLGNLRLTRLYEYYMMSVPLNEQGAARGEIPRPVLMYFLHGSDLDYRANALLYRYIYDRRTSLPEFYESYEPRIREFVARQIATGRIDETLSALYKRFLEVDMVTKDNAAQVLAVLHMNRIRVADPRISEVVVIYDKLLQERRYPVTGGEARVPLYGSEYSVLLEDKDHHRYAEGIEFDMDKLMIPGRLTQMVAPLIGEGEEYIDLFLCEQGGGIYSINMENARGFRMLASSDQLEMECRKEIRQQLIRFYHENDFTRQLAEALQEEDPSELPAARRNELLELMVLYGSADRALLWLKRFGTFGIDARIIMRLCNRMPDPQAYHGDRAVHEIVFYAFQKGRYDAAVLEFLVAAFSGTIREMRDIWKATASFEVDNFALSERMLYQMLYSGAYVGDRMEIFRAYIRQGADNGPLETAFLAQSAYDHFVRESVTSEFVYRRIGRLLAADVPLPEVCAMDYLKFFAGHRSGEFDRTLAEKLIAQLIAKDIYYPFFTEYTDILPRTGRFAERIILQYRTRPHRRCIVHYRLGTDEGTEGAYTTRRMREMYDSIYVMSFVLFFGEEVQYYITESADDDEETPQLTESGTLIRGDIRQNTPTAGAFTMINDLCIAETLKDYETFDRLLGEYFHTQYLAEQLFYVKDRDEGLAS